MSSDPQGLEDALQAHQEKVEALLKTASKYMNALKAWRKACQTGEMAARTRAAALATGIAGELAAPVTETAGAWTFDVEEYLSGAGWQQELVYVAYRNHGLRALIEEQTVVSSPLVVSSRPKLGVLTLGKLRWTRLRPSAVAHELNRLREAQRDVSCQEVLEGLYGLWARIPPDERRTLKLVEAYARFCDAPGWKKENSRLAFAQAVYALDRSDVKQTRKGIRYEILGPSGDPKERDILTVRSETGQTIRYWGIRFRE